MGRRASESSYFDKKHNDTSNSSPAIPGEKSIGERDSFLQKKRI
jgi:hypothetical protein